MPRPLVSMPPDLVARAERGIADIDGWDIARLARDMARKWAAWGDRMDACRGCGGDVYDVGTPGVRYCDECREAA